MLLLLLLLRNVTRQSRRDSRLALQLLRLRTSSLTLLLCSSSQIHQPLRLSCCEPSSRRRPGRRRVVLRHLCLRPFVCRSRTRLYKLSVSVGIRIRLHRLAAPARHHELASSVVAAGDLRFLRAAVPRRAREGQVSDRRVGVVLHRYSQTGHCRLPMPMPMTTS